jgi:hypothetical protein
MLAGLDDLVDTLERVARGDHPPDVELPLPPIRKIEAVAIRWTMQVWSVVAGKTAVGASLMRLRPLVTAMRISWQPRVFRSDDDLHPEFRASVCLTQTPKDVAAALGEPAGREIHHLTGHRWLRRGS